MTSGIAEASRSLCLCDLLTSCVPAFLSNPSFMIAIQRLTRTEILRLRDAELAARLRRGRDPSRRARPVPRDQPRADERFQRQPRAERAGPRLRYAAARGAIPNQSPDSAQGLPPVRAEWISEARGRRRVRRPRDQARGQRLPHARPRRIRQHRRAQESPRTFQRLTPQTAPRLRRPSRHATLVCAPGHHHARDGVYRHPRKSRTRTQNGRMQNSEERGTANRDSDRSYFVLRTSTSRATTRSRHQHAGESFGASDPEGNHPRVRPVAKSPAAAPSSPPTSTIPSSSR